MAESRTDDVNEMNVDCSIQNCSRGSVTLGDDDDDDNVNNEKSRDQNNMAAPIKVTNNVESLFLASMHQNSQMIKTLTDNLANLQRQLLTNKTSTLDNTKKVVNSSPELEDPCTSRSCTSRSENGHNSAKKRKLDDNDTNDCHERDEFDNILMDSDEGEQEKEEEEEGEIDTNELLADLEDCFGSDEKCSENIMEKLAKVANDGLRTKLNGEKIKEVADKYFRPKNVENLKTPTVNNEIWRHLDRRVKNQDLKLSKTQALICKALTPQLQLIDILLNKQSKKEKLQPKDVLKLAMDTLKVMTFVYCDLSYRRREMIIQPGKNEEFRGLCSHDHPVTDNLFGDDLEKTVESIVKRNKVGYRISGGYRGKGKQIPGRWVAKSSNFKKDNQSDEKFKTNGGASFLDRRWRKKHRGKSY